MAKDLVLDVIARKNTRDLSLLADEFDRLAKQTDDFGNKLHKTGTFSQFLEAELVKTKARVRELAEEFDRTGKGGDLLAGARRNEKSLEKIKKDLTKALEDGAKDGADLGLKEVENEFSTKGPALAGLIVGAVAAAAPAINGLILGAAGLGGIGLGIAGQLHDPAVHKAIADVGNDLLTEFHKDTRAFAEPLIGAVRLVGGSLQSALDSIHFDRLAKLLDPLASGVGGAITNLMPGINHMLTASEPIIRDLASELPQVAHAFSDMFDDFAKAGPGAEEGLRALLMLVEGLAEGTGKTVETFSGIYDGVVHTEDAISHWVNSWQHGIPVIGAVSDKVTGILDHIVGGTPAVETWGKLLLSDAQAATQGYNTLADALNRVVVDQDTLAGAAVGKVFAGLMSVDEATLHWHESLTRLHDEMGKHSNDIRETTKEGEKNVGLILASVQANMAQYQSFIAVGGSAMDAARQYDQNTAALEKQLRQAGLTQAQIDGLIGKYRSIPDTVNTRIQLEGIEVAINRVDTLLRKLQGLPIGHEISGIGGGAFGPPSLPHVGPQNRASGGPVGAGVYQWQEQGREYLSMPDVGGGPAYVTPNSAINGAANRGGGAGDVIGVLRVDHYGPSGEYMRTEFVNLARRRGYSSVDQLLPVGTAR